YNKNEVILGLLMVHPILQYLANAVTVTILNYGDFKIIRYLQTYFFYTTWTRSTNLGHEFTCLKNLSNISHWNFSTSNGFR
ncbi:12165_t:CDS:2, partial [Rhizophagus irregularis]